MKPDAVSTKKETWLLMGASRGLGRAFLEFAQKASPHLKLICISRKTQSFPEGIQSFSYDFSEEKNWDLIGQEIQNLKPDRVFYFAGGGPFGRFQDKQWKDHMWSLKVSFLFPAYLLHLILNSPLELKQFVLIGSSIAESKPDPSASSYCAAKHALKGLITSVQSEQKTAFDLRLVSPGYMDTSLLPANAWPRQLEGLVVSPEKAAQLLWASIHNADDVNKHCVLDCSL